MPDMKEIKKLATNTLGDVQTQRLRAKTSLGKVWGPNKGPYVVEDKQEGHSSRRYLRLSQNLPKHCEKDSCLFPEVPKTRSLTVMSHSVWQPHMTD